MSGRLIAIGDIHGNAKALAALIAFIDPDETDRLVFLGDYVDRGSGSREVIDILLRLKDRCECHFLLGNHEEMMLATMKDPETFSIHWDRYGGSATCKSYGVNTPRELRSKIPAAHMAFLENLVPFLEINGRIFTHAGYEPGKSPQDQDVRVLRYNFLDAAHPENYTGQEIICGHSSQKSGLPLQIGDVTCIDTNVAGILTAYDLTNQIYYQATAVGEVNAPQKLPSRRQAPCKEL